MQYATIGWQHFVRDSTAVAEPSAGIPQLPGPSLGGGAAHAMPGQARANMREGDAKQVW